MKKYLSFAKYYLKNQFASPIAYIASIVSYVIHILVLNQLFVFIFADKTVDGFGHSDLVWYVIIGEVFMYSFHNGFKAIASDITNGDIAYNLSKPYNFMLRIISEQLSTCTRTIILLVLGTIIGLALVGPIEIGLTEFLLFLLVFILSLFIQLLLHLIVGILSLWMGRDVTSIWWIVQKFMLVLIFTPLEFFPKVIQNIFMFLPTTHVSYTPAQLLVHFSYSNFIESLVFVTGSIVVLSGVCTVLYKKGVKKLNVNGI